MGIPISADEVLEMACEMERNGGAFYRRAAEAAADDANRQLLTKLAGMEDDHLETFSALREEFAKGGGVVRADDEAVLYLRAAVDGRVFDRKADPMDIFNAGATMADILRTAVGLEKESVVYYTGLKELLLEAGGGQKIEAIIKQEMGHVLTLTNELNRL